MVADYPTERHGVRWHRRWRGPIQVLVMVVAIVGATAASRISSDLSATEQAAAAGMDFPDDTRADPTTTSTAATIAARGDGERSADARRRGEAALDSIAYPWRDRLPGWEIRFVPADRGAYGYTLTEERVIEINVRPDQPADLLVHVIAHELGHALDVTYNDGDDRRRWQEARGIDDAPWWPGSRAADFATGAGDFAESFAAWQVGPGEFRSELGEPPTGPQLDLLAELVP